MIGDLLSNLSRANKLGVSDIQRAIQDGTLPAYVGVPLLQQKMQQRQQAAGMLSGQQAQNQPPIGQQIMDQANQMIHGGAPQQPPMPQPQEAAPQGIDAAQSNLPAQGYAPGGIVAFADGGDAEDDSDAESAQYRDPGELSSEEKTLLAQYQSPISMPTRRDYSYSDEADLGLPGIAASNGKPSSTNINSVPPPAQNITAPKQESTMSGRLHKYQAEITDFANKHHLNPFVALAVARNETGGLSNPESAVSRAGAEGVMQLMPKTARGLGVQDSLNPMQNIEGGVTYLSQMFKKYNGDPSLALAAYNAGPGTVDKALKSGNGISSLPKETQNYVAKALSFLHGQNVPGFAGGGIIALADGGDIDYGALYEPEITKPIQARQAAIAATPTGRALTQAQETAAQMDRSQLRAPRSAASTSVNPSFVSVPPEETARMNEFETSPTDSLQHGYDSFFNMYGNMGQPTIETPAATEPGKEESTYTSRQTAGDEYLKKFGDYIDSQKQSLEQQKSLSPWLALLGAGAGMMGRSNFAAPNIGAGITAGLGAYGNLRGMEAKQEAGIAGALSTAARAQLMNESRLDRIKEMSDYHKGMTQERAAAAQQALQLGRERIAAAQQMEKEKLSAITSKAQEAAGLKRQEITNARTKAIQDEYTKWEASPVGLMAAQKRAKDLGYDDVGTQKYIQDEFRAHFGRLQSLLGGNTPSGFPKDTDLLKAP
jgi:soluble lytic murein transglycosylase-like protein